MAAPQSHLLNERTTLDSPLGDRTIYRLDDLEGVADVEKMPYCIKVLLESCRRHCGDGIVEKEDVDALARYNAQDVGEVEIPFTPGRDLRLGRGHQDRPLNYFIYPYVEVGGKRYEGPIESNFSYRNLGSSRD